MTTQWWGGVGGWNAESRLTVPLGGTYEGCLFRFLHFIWKGTVGTRERWRLSTAALLST